MLQETVPYDCAGPAVAILTCQSVFSGNQDDASLRGLRGVTSLQKDFIHWRIPISEMHAVIFVTQMT